MNKRLIALLAIAGGAYFLYRKSSNAVPAIVSQRPEKYVSPEGQKAFISAIERYAPEIEGKYGIKPVITISQASLESTFGSSGLARQGKNLYGIKATKAWIAAGKPVWTGQTEEFVGGKSILIKDTFKKYGSWKESIEDWAQLISGVYKTAYRYAKAGDVAGYGQAIVNTGYSTHPLYAKMLVKASSAIT